MARPAKAKRVKALDGTFVVRGKAANGEGSLYQEANGTWRATYRVPGQSKVRRVRGRTREEAMRRRGEALLTALETTGPAPAPTVLHARTTLAELAGWWLKNIARHRVRVSSFGKYEDRVERILPVLGDVRVGILRPEQVAAWQAGLLGSLSAKTVADTRATLRAMVGEAVSLGIIAVNPVDRVKPATGPTAEPSRTVSARGEGVGGRGRR